MPTYPTLAVSPDSTGYTIKFPNGIVSSGPMDGGSDLRRADVIGGTGQCDVQWSCNPDRYNYILAFFRTKIQQGTGLFYLSLAIDNADLTPYLCAFIPGTLSLPNTAGYSTTIKASLEVYPLPVDAVNDSSLIDVYGAYGDNSANILALLAHVVNVSFPATRFRRK